MTPHLENLSRHRSAAVGARSWGQGEAGVMENPCPPPRPVAGNVPRLSSQEGAQGPPSSDPGTGHMLHNHQGRSREGSRGAGLPTSKELLMGTDRADTDLPVDHVHTAEAGDTERGRSCHPTVTQPHWGSPHTPTPEVRPQPESSSTSGFVLPSSPTWAGCCCPPCAAAASPPHCPTRAHL